MISSTIKRVEFLLIEEKRRRIWKDKEKSFHFRIERSFELNV